MTINSLRHDPLLQILCERGINEEQPLASASTHCRLENRLDRKCLAKMADVAVSKRWFQAIRERIQRLWKPETVPG